MNGLTIAVIVVLLLLVLYLWSRQPSAPATGAPAVASAPPAGELPAFLGANDWENRLPSGARTVFKFIFQGGNVLMSSAGYTAEGSAAGEPSGATVSWTQTGPDVVQLSQGATKLDLRRTGAKNVSLGLSGGPGRPLTAVA